MSPSQLTLLLPPWDVVRRQGGAAALAAARGRGDLLERAQPGRRAQQMRIFSIVPKPPSWAAITRQSDCGDADGSLWLRSDPANLRVEPGGLRLMATGEALALAPAESEAFAATVRPLFHDVGMRFSAPTPHRWYVQLARGRPLPAFVDPESALGTFNGPLPADATPPREWMRVLNEAQMALHLHPANVARMERGLLAVNSLWLWGAGELPLKVSSQYTAVASDDDDYRALATAARLALRRRDDALSGADGSAALLDARPAPREAAIRTALDALAQGNISSLRLDSEDGTIFESKRWHRWRFWR